MSGHQSPHSALLHFFTKKCDERKKALRVRRTTVGVDQRIYVFTLPRYDFDFDPEQLECILFLPQLMSEVYVTAMNLVIVTETEKVVCSFWFDVV
jgi:hypothetical protein